MDSNMIMGNDMTDFAMGGFAMGGIGMLLAAVLTIVAIAALVKYLRN